MARVGSHVKPSANIALKQSVSWAVFCHAADLHRNPCCDGQKNDFVPKRENQRFWRTRRQVLRAHNRECLNLRLCDDG